MHLQCNSIYRYFNEARVTQIKSIGKTSLYRGRKCHSVKILLAFEKKQGTFFTSDEHLLSIFCIERTVCHIDILCPMWFSSWLFSKSILKAEYKWSFTECSIRGNAWEYWGLWKENRLKSDCALSVLYHNIPFQKERRMVRRVISLYR